jgi:hypothetical protein
MAVTDITEKANEIREEKASSLKSFFANCFTPPETLLEDQTKDSENAIPSANDTRKQNDIYLENEIPVKNDTHSDNNIHTKNTTRSENNMLLNIIYPNNDIHIGNDIRSNNDTYIKDEIHTENNISIENNTPENNTRIEFNTIENTTHMENDTIVNDTYSEIKTRKYGTHTEDTTPESATHTQNETRESDIYIENDTRENNTYISSATYNGNTVRLADLLGFTALGVLAVLIDEFPSASGMLNVTQLSKSCGVARTTLIAQLRSLEKASVIRLGEAEKQGRRLEILCIKNTTYIESNTLTRSSSSYFKNINNNYNREDISYTENETQRINATHIEKDTRVGRDTHSNNDTLENTIRNDKDIYSKNDIYIENNTLENTIRSDNDTRNKNTIYTENNIVVEKLSKSKITLRVAARELYFTAKASGLNPDRLTEQCFQQFLSVKQSKGSRYAIALFHNLLTKSKDNPNAYVIRAIQQGATPSLEDEQRAENISQAGETVFKKIGVEILQRDLDSALSQLSLAGHSQEQLNEDLDLFTRRIVD